MGSACGTGARLIFLALVFLREACFFAFRVGPLQLPRNGLRMGTAPPRGTAAAAAGPMTTRLDAIKRMAAAISLLPGAAGVVAGGGVGFPKEAQAAGGGGAAGEAGKKEWISGKGAQPKGSDDKTGTRKESKYLRCLSNCLADCQKPTYGPEKDREECLQTCQDECCTSYEQCTYAVTQNK